MLVLILLQSSNAINFADILGESSDGSGSSSGESSSEESGNEQGKKRIWSC